MFYLLKAFFLNNYCYDNFFKYLRKLGLFPVRKYNDSFYPFKLYETTASITVVSASLWLKLGLNVVISVNKLPRFEPYHITYRHITQKTKGITNRE